jgi:hypothetical protein
MMSVVGRIAAMLLIALSTFCAACAEPPNNEMQQAQGAIDAARAAGADQYAHDEFAAAVDALKRANDAVADRDYRLALDNALDSRERARNATKQASDQKAAERAAAERAILAASKGIATAQSRIQTSDGGRTPARTLANARRKVSESEKQLQEARAAFDAGDYPKATEAATTITGQLADATRDLEPAPAGPPKRKR